MTTVWTFAQAGDKWTAAAQFLEKDKVIGSAVGGSPAAAGPSLSVKQIWGKEGKPRGGWIDDATLTFTPAADGKVKMEWKAGGFGGGFTMEPAAAVAVPATDPAPMKKDPPVPPPPATAADRLVGKWVGDVDGFTEYWTVTKTDDKKWSATAEYFTKGGKSVTTASAEGPTADDESLTFKLLYGRGGKPRGSWDNDITLTLTPADGKKVKVAWKSGGRSGTRIWDADKSR